MIYYIYNTRFFLVMGMLEAVLWHFTVNKLSKRTLELLHIPLLVIRGAWFYWLWIATEHDGGSLIALFMCYPFWHLGTMYQFRHWLNRSIYEYGFFSNASSSSTSKWDSDRFPYKLLPKLDAQLRTILLILGTFFYLLWNL